MSGDVQPRKRKDKKKKRDVGGMGDRKSEPDLTFSRHGSFQDDESSHGVHITKMGADDIHLHVQHDHGTGGHWCAKIIFFFLMAILVGLVGIIIVENRDSTDMDTPLSESRFSTYFQGWVDEHRQEEEHNHDDLDHHDDHEEMLEHDKDDDEHDADLDNDDEEDEEEHDEDVDQDEHVHEDEDEGQNGHDNDAEDDDDEEEYLDGNERDMENVIINDGDDEDMNDINPEEYAQFTRKANDDDNDDNDDNEDEEGDNDENNYNIDDNDDDGDNDNDMDDNYQNGDGINGDDGEDFDDDNENDDDEDFDQIIDNDAGEIELLKERARQQAAAEEATKNKYKQQEDDHHLDTDENDNDEANNAPHWTNAQIRTDTQQEKGPKIISSDDNDFEKELRRANEEMMRESYNQAVQMLKKLKEKYPKRSQIDLNLARTLDAYAEQQQSNAILMSAIKAYQQYLQSKPNQMVLHEYKEAAKRCLDRMTFLGDYQRMISVLKQLMKQFPQDVTFYNQLVITYVLTERISDAKMLVKEILQKWPDDGLAAVHYGFILKQYDENLEQAVFYLEQGLASRAIGTEHGRFYFHLGDALQRLGHTVRAYQIYQQATDLKLFPSIYQRSLYNVPNLRAQPFWTKHQTGYSYWFEKIEKHWLSIRAEGLNALQKLKIYQNETENLTNKGEWQQLELFNRGQKSSQHCLIARITCKLIEEFPAARTCLRGQVKFSVMQGGTHVWPHCGPTNCRLRAHLGLIIPSGTFVRVAEEENTWQEGKFLIFDDSFEHEVWHNGTGLRLVLIIDVWHPDLTAQQRYSLSPL